MDKTTQDVTPPSELPGEAPTSSGTPAPGEDAPGRSDEARDPDREGGVGPPPKATQRDVAGESEAEESLDIEDRRSGE